MGGQAESYVSNSLIRITSLRVPGEESDIKILHVPKLVMIVMYVGTYLLAQHSGDRDLCEVKVNLVYIVSSRTAQSYVVRPYLQN